MKTMDNKEMMSRETMNCLDDFMGYSSQSYDESNKTQQIEEPVIHVKEKVSKNQAKTKSGKKTTTDNVSRNKFKKELSTEYVGLKIPKSLYDFLYEEAYEEDVSMSKLVKRILTNYKNDQ